MALNEKEHILVDPAIKAYKENGNRTYFFRLSNEKILASALSVIKKLFLEGYICDVSPELFDIDSRPSNLAQKYHFTITDKLIKESEWNI